VQGHGYRARSNGREGDATAYTLREIRQHCQPPQPFLRGVENLEIFMLFATQMTLLLLALGFL
jgi:hypothetical protein